MTNIAVSMLPEEGHVIPSFKIAKTLKARGHNVYYIGVPDFEPYVRRQNLEFVPFMEQVFPKGSREAQVQILATRRGLSNLREASHARFYRQLCGQAQQSASDIKQLLEREKPDLLIVDSFLAPLALIGYSLSIPVVLLSININLPQADNYPPVVTDIIPEDTPASRSKAAIAWKISAAMRGLTSMAVGCNFDKELKKAAAACKYPVEQIESAAQMPRVRPSRSMPELILCPQPFDFPRPAGDSDGCFYIEPSLDLEHANGTFPWERIAPEKPLVFCSLGSQSHIFKNGRAFFQRVIDAFAGKPEWQLVLAVGQHISPDSFQNIPANAVVVPWAPHAEIMKRASIMINHAGLGTIKECIYFGVPMLLFPELRDQPGYAARAVYHGLGLRGNIGKVSSAQILEMLDTINNDSSFKERVGAMSKAFQELELSQKGIRIVEVMLQAGSLPECF